MILEDVVKTRFPSVFKQLGAAPEAPLPAIDKELAALWAHSQVKTAKRDVLYLVAGFGEHVAALLPRLDPTAVLVVYEASLGRLKSALKAKDYSGILGDNRVHLFAGELSAMEFERLHQLPAARIKDVAVLRFNPALSMDAKRYDQFLTEFMRQFDVVRRLHLTNFYDSIFWQAMTLENLPHHYQSPDIATLKGAFKDIPVVLVGAGPSLKEAGEFLKQASQKALIVASNSSYKQLIKLGVKPHFLLAADPRHYTSKGVAGENIDEVTLVAPFIVHNEIVQRFKGRAFSWSGENNVLVSVLRKRLGLGEGTTLIEKGTISLSIADFARHIGSKTLVLVGQDLATTVDGQTHTEASIYSELKVNKVDLKYREDSSDGSGNARKVPGNTVEWVPTLENLYTYLKLFEQWVEANPEMKVINTARLGAKIQGVPYASFADAASMIAEYSHASPILARIKTLLENAREHNLSFDEWLRVLQPTHAYAQKLYNQALLGATTIEMLPERFSQQAMKGSREIQEIAALATSINKLIDQNPDDYKVLLEGFLKKRLLDFQGIYSALEAPTPQALTLLQNKEFFWALAEGIEPTLGYLNRLYASVAQTV